MKNIVKLKQNFNGFLQSCEECGNTMDDYYFAIQNNAGEYITLCSHCAAIYMAETLSSVSDYDFDNCID